MSGLEEKINPYDSGPYHWFLPCFYARKHERQLELVTGLLRPADVVLDLGCGDGRLTVLSGTWVHAIVGLDHQLLPLQFARLLAEADSHRLCLGVATALLFRPQSFDVVTCLDMIEHFPQGWVFRLLAEVRRMLRPAGLLVLTTPNCSSPPNQLWGIV